MPPEIKKVCAGCENWEVDVADPKKVEWCPVLAIWVAYNDNCQYWQESTCFVAAQMFISKKV